MKCGLCLPYCPTYRLFGIENESPRGRISLIQGLLAGGLKPDPTLCDNINHCLSCMACENVCPAQVDYTTLIEHAKTITLPSPRPWYERFALYGLLTKPKRLAWLYRIIRLYQRSGLARLNGVRAILNGLQLWNLAQNAPSLQSLPRWRPHYRPASPQAKIGLFLGCVGRFFDQKSLHASRLVLNALGYDVIVPGEQSCCGALYAHNGDLQIAQRMAAELTALFLQHGVDTVVYTASGCGAQFLRYHRLTDKTNVRFVEIQDFLLQHSAFQLVALKPLASTVAVHEPCSMVNVLKQSTNTYKLLARIPGLTVQSLTEKAACCGAAGSYMIRYPHIARRLLEDKLQAVKKIDASWLVSSNIGCSLHLHTGLSEIQSSIKLCHPIELIQQQWPDSYQP